MKKLVKIVALLLAVMTVAVAATACSVGGNTYKYEKSELVGEFDLTESQKTAALAIVDSLMKSTSYSFEKDGTYGRSFWKQSGSKVYVVSNKDDKAEDGTLLGEVKGGNFVVSFENDGKKFNLIYKKA